MTKHSPTSAAVQLPLLKDDIAMLPVPVVNVMSVPQRSVFRYPGGKTWLVPYFRRWVSNRDSRPIELIEPFAGGGIIGLTAVFENLVNRITLVERDEQVAAVWKTLLSSDSDWLAERILAFDFNSENVDRVLGQAANATREIAFQVILKNRVNRGGILARGAGRIKNGEKEKEIASRWYPGTLARRIKAIASVRDRIRFVEGDGIACIQEMAERDDVIYFVDPPYTASQKRAGNRLYTHSAIDHDGLFATMSRVTGDFILTYDNAEEIHKLVERYGFVAQPIAMKNTHHAPMTELIISPSR